MSNRKIGPWTINSERIAFANPWISVEDHAVTHPDGSPGEYGVVRFKNIAVGILPIDDEGDIWLVGQHRYPHDCYSWELPEGGAPLKEPPLDAAKRELEEEVGVIARDWHDLGGFDISNSVTDEKARCYLAWNLGPGKAAPEPSEALTLKKVKFKELLEMVMDGTISDSLTIIIVLRAHFLALRGKAPEPISQYLCAGYRALQD